MTQALAAAGAQEWALARKMTALRRGGSAGVEEEGHEEGASPAEETEETVAEETVAEETAQDGWPGDEFGCACS